MEKWNFNRPKVILAEMSLSDNWLAESFGRSGDDISVWRINTIQSNVKELVKPLECLHVGIEGLVSVSRKENAIVQ